MISGKFAISTHILTLLALNPDKYLASDYIAGSLNIHPVLVRKEISNLKKHHLVESKEGKNGGARLMKSAGDITLETIFKITFDTISLGYSKNNPNPECTVGKQINKNLEKIYIDINENISNRLKAITLEKFSSGF